MVQDGNNFWIENLERERFSIIDEWTDGRIIMPQSDVLCMISEKDLKGLQYQTHIKINVQSLFVKMFKKPRWNIIHEITLMKILLLKYA